METQKFSSNGIENLTLLLVYLTSWDENKKKEYGDRPILRSWKNHDFNILDSLIKKGLIRYGSKTKSVYLTENGIQKALNFASRLSFSAEVSAEQILVNGEKLDLIVECRDVKRAYGRREGDKYRIVMPSRYSEQQKQEHINWFRNNIQRKKPAVSRGKFIQTYRDFKTGDVLDFGDTKYAIKIDFVDKQSSSAKLVQGTIHLLITSNIPDENKKIHINNLIRRIVSAQRAHILKHKIEELNKKYFNVKFNNIRWSKQSSRWGSCSENGNINISYRLLFAPTDVLESVCIHELAHLIESNHSENFWRLVETAMPNYKEKAEWLDVHGNKLEQPL